MNKLYKYKDGKRVRVLDDVKCPVCEQEFPPKDSSRKYCSRECYYKMKRARGDRVEWTQKMRDRMSEKYTGSGNPMYGKPSPLLGRKRPDISGEKHPRWKGGYVNGGGYRMLCVNGIEKSEQRRIMEMELGRELTSDEVVHHIDRDKLNNASSNLAVVSRAEHMNIHREDILSGSDE